MSLPARAILSLIVLAAMAAACWGIYSAGSRAGADAVRQEWGRETASRALRTAEKVMEYREKERAMAADAARERRKRDAEEKRIAAVHSAELDGLRNRPELRAHDRPGEAADPASTGVGCTGSGLARGDAAFLTGYAADVARLAAEFRRCASGYDSAERALR